MAFPYKYLKYIYAQDGDLQAIPDATQVNGSISYDQGEGPLYEADPSSNPNALSVARKSANQIRNDVTGNLQYWQRHCAPEFIDATTNGTSNPGYPQTSVNGYLLGDIVRYNTNTSGTGPATYDVFVSLKGTAAAPNTDLPTVAGSWISLTIAVTQRVRLAANQNYYVSTAGNDSTGNGTSALPWATPQRAANYILNNVDLAGYTATVNVGNGTYTAGVAIPFALTSGMLAFVGNNGTPTSCIINATGDAFSGFNGASYSVSGFQVYSSSGSAISAYSGSRITAGAMAYGNVGSSAAHMLAIDPGSLITVNANYAINGGALYHYDAVNYGQVKMNGLTVNISGTPAFTGAFAATATGVCQITNMTYSGGLSGSSVKYSAILNGVINTAGGGPNYFPGNTGGSTSTGGQYV